MATISAKIFKHHKKTDGTYNVKVCITHNRLRAYLDTEHYVTDKQLTKKRDIKDQFILTCVNRTLDAYRRTISEMGTLVDSMSANSIREYLLKKDQKIDFLNFCGLHLKQMEADGRHKSLANCKTVCNSIVDFLDGKKELGIEQITPDFLARYERYLRGTRMMTRRNQFGKEYSMIGKPLGDASVHVYLRDFSGFFTAAMRYYNKPSLGLTPIKFNPFDEYKIVQAPETGKRNVDVDHIKKIRDVLLTPDSRTEMARDLFMLSFYLCGINAVDLYKENYKINRGRIEYKRSKTCGRRADNAFISIKMPPPALKIFKRYDGILREKYTCIGNLNKALSVGMRKLQEIAEIPDITFYWARHSFGNIARNVCRKSKDDIALAMNHVDSGKKTTDIYLQKDWKIVDEVQQAVLNLLSTDKRRIEVGEKSVRYIFQGIILSRLDPC